MIDLDLTTVEPLPLADPPELEGGARTLAHATWRGRMLNEHVSARVFAGLVDSGMRAGIGSARLEALAQMISDELRHAKMCASVLTALGGEARTPLPALDSVPMHDDAPALEGFLRNVISVSCLSETVAVALIGAERLEVETPEISQVLKRILADEVQHARIGWKLLADLGPELDDSSRSRLSEYLVDAFESLEAHELSHIPAQPCPSIEAARAGVCDGREARSLFYETVQTVIVPGLEAQGLRARDAWMAASGRQRQESLA